MRVKEIAGVAVDGAGTIFVVASDGRVAALRRDRLVPVDAPPPDSRIASISARPEGGVFAADTLSNCVRAVTPEGRWELYAGAPQPPSLDARARRADGPGLEARFRTPSILASAGARLVCIEAGAPAIRVLSDGKVATIDLGTSPLATITAASVAGDGALYLADAVTPVPLVVRCGADGRVEPVAGDSREPGDRDGTGSTARFARIAALAATPDGCYAADGSRIRFVSTTGIVTTVAGAEPGFRDGPGPDARFGAVPAIALSPDGALVVADPDNGAIRRVAPSGTVSTIFRDSTAKAFGAAIIDGDTDGAWALAESLLAEHARLGASRPDRALHPVSVASARVGRAMAVAWSESSQPNRARLGAYCLWLVRSEEAIGAPVEDAVRLVGLVSEALDAGDLARVKQALDLVRIAFGGLGRRRDRLAVAEAYRRTNATRQVADLFAAAERSVRAVAADIVEQARDIRFTPSLAALANDGDDAAAHALRTIWDSPAFSSEQAAELRAGLRFGRGVITRLLADRGDEALGRHGAARYRRVVAGTS